jgi:hypothetical protein
MARGWIHQASHVRWVGEFHPILLDCFVAAIKPTRSRCDGSGLFMTHESQNRPSSSEIIQQTH